MRVVWDGRTRRWSDGRYLAGGVPWGLLRLSPEARDIADRLRSCGRAGFLPVTPAERTLVHLLVDRGVAHPAPEPRSVTADEVLVIIPVFGRADLLEACLASVGRVPVIVVDDASPNPDDIRRVSQAHGATLIRHAVNQGPGAARNTALAITDAPIVAFLDSDCRAPARWLEELLPHFDDPRVGLIAPRVRPRPAGRSLLARHEDARSALDMGARPELVRHGARLGFLPSAALVARRAALPVGGFEPTMRVGEDVDLVWRTIDAGWHARYEPTVTVLHEMRLAPLAWARRRLEYGTSASVLDRRHPGRLAPAKISAWNLAIAVIATARRPVPAAGVAAIAVTSLGRGLARSGVPAELAVRVVAKGLMADVLGVGHALRREWWPLGWFGLATARRSRWAKLATISMTAPILLEYLRNRPPVDPIRYTALRLLEDAAYGSGVLLSVVRTRSPRALVPQVRWPRSRRP